MLNKFKHNYNLTLWLTRLGLLLSFTFANIFDIESILTYMSLASQGVPIPRNILMFLFVGLVISIFFELGLRFVYWGLTKFLHIYTLPKSEVILVIMILTVLRNIVLGLVNLLFFISPIVYSFFGVIIEMLVTAPFAFWLFKIMEKRYLNAQTAPFIFKVISITFLIYYLLSAISSMRGGI